MIFGSDWAQLNKDTKRILSVIMRRATKSIEFTSGHVVTMNLESFVSVSNTKLLILINVGIKKILNFVCRSCLKLPTRRITCSKVARDSTISTYLIVETKIFFDSKERIITYWKSVDLFRICYNDICNVIFY